MIKNINECFSSQLYNDQSINIALTYQKNLNADFGGTELMQPLRDMYNSPLSSDYTRVAFLLTDGDVGNQDEVDVYMIGDHFMWSLGNGFS